MMPNLEIANKADHLITAETYIQQILNQLLIKYQNTQLEREKISLWEENQEFSILGIVEIFTDDIRGYAFQVIRKNYSTHAQNILNELEKLKILEITEVTNWYFNPKFDYPKMKQYIEILNYLRLLIIEYIRNLKT
ncbi:MAG: hypothetical protein F6K14_27925 [Symploca sp. SIO2C1]|nr:hypothetical protein [Symploca sp. SIO2C1]